jgi:hypothetical protein
LPYGNPYGSYGSGYGSYGSPYGDSSYGSSYESLYDPSYSSDADLYPLYNTNGDNVYLQNKNANQNENYRSAVNGELMGEIQTLMDQINALMI